MQRITLLLFLLGSVSAISADRLQNYTYDFSIPRAVFTMKPNLISQYKLNVGADQLLKNNPTLNETYRSFNYFALSQNGKSCVPGTYEVQVFNDRAFYSYYELKNSIQNKVMPSLGYNEISDYLLSSYGGVVYKKNGKIIVTSFHKASPFSFVWSACTLG